MPLPLAASEQTLPRPLGAGDDDTNERDPLAGRASQAGPPPRMR